MSNASNEVLTVIKKVIVDLKPGMDFDLKPEMNLMKDGNLDSLDMIGLFFELEKAFNIQIPQPDVESHQLTSLANLVKYIDQRRSK